MSESTERSGEPVSEGTGTSGRKVGLADELKNRLTGHEDDAPRGRDAVDEGTGGTGVEDTGAEEAGPRHAEHEGRGTGTGEEAGTGEDAGGERTGTGDRSDVSGSSTHTTRETTREVVDEVTSEAHRDES